MSRFWRSLRSLYGRFAERCLLAGVERPSSAPVFVVGSPRSGTTIVSQQLLATLETCYFSNLDRANFRYPAWSAWRNRSADKFVARFENDTGRIAGEHSPSDGWEIFLRWFSYDADPRASAPSGDDLQRTIAYYESLYRRPLLVKNNANSLRVAELATWFPRATFIQVRRALDECVASVLEVRQRLGIARGRFWAGGPADGYLDAPPADDVELCVLQHLVIDRYLAAMRDRLGRRFLEIDYAEFCQAPNATTATVASATEVRRRASPPTPFGAIRSDRRPVEPELQRRIRAGIDAQRDHADRVVGRFVDASNEKFALGEPEPREPAPEASLT